MEPAFNNCLLLPRAIPGKPGSRGYNLRGKGLRPSSSSPPVPTLSVFQRSHRRTGLFQSPCPHSGISALQCSTSCAGTGVHGYPKSALGAGTSHLEVHKARPICSKSLQPAPKGGGSTHVQAPRSMTAVSLPTEHPRDCQPPLRIGHTHTHTPVPPPCGCGAVCPGCHRGPATRQGSADTTGTKISVVAGRLELAGAVTLRPAKPSWGQARATGTNLRLPRCWWHLGLFGALGTSRG